MARIEGSPVPIGVNGPGAMGSGVVRVTELYPDFGFQVSAINYHSDNPRGVAGLIQDSVLYGHFPKEVDYGSDFIAIDGRRINFLVGQKPAEITWPQDNPVELVFECARSFNDPRLAGGHLREGGPFKAIISSSPKGDEPCPVIVYGVNQEIYDPRKHNVISAATCSTNALVAAVDVLHREFGLEALKADTIHAATGENDVYDTVGSGSGIIDNIIPETTGAAKTLFKVIPELEDRIGQNTIITAKRVAVSTGSIFNITAILEKSVKNEDVIEAFSQAASERLKGVLALSNRPVSASSLRGTHFAAVVSAESIQTVMGGRLVSLDVGYDNVDGYIAQMLRVGRYVHEQSLE